jgi:hypothetical protein
MAVDKAEEKIGKRIVNSEEVQKIIDIVEEFLKLNNLICYGGTTINNILPEEDQFYNKDIEIPDYDFFSQNALEDTKKLADIYYKKGFTDVEITPVKTIHEAINQRLRWAGKTTKLPFTRSAILHFIFAFFSALHAVAVIGIFFPSIQKMSVAFLILKISFEAIGVLNVFPNRMKGKEIIVLVPQMLLYPFFSLFIFITSLFFVPKWKGRRVSLK